MARQFVINDILTTKLGRTAAPRQMVVRAQIVEACATHWREHRACAIVAPAGYGKTTLLRQLRETFRAQGLATAWFSIDAGDNDAVRFVAYIAAALDEAVPGIATRALAQLELGNRTSPRTALTTLLVDMQTLDRPLVLFLDDLHEIVDTDGLELLERLLALAPPLLHAVVASRRAALPGAAQMRLRGQLVEFGFEALALSRDELREFCRLHDAGDVDDAFVERLHASTEGWAAGIQLFFLAATGRDARQQLLAAFDGTHRGIADYLAEALLARLDDDMREFLLSTSVLERMNAALCGALLPQVNGQAMLERIEAAGLFLIPLDRTRGWYRYHPLFRDQLRAGLELQQPGAALALQLRASDWCAEHEFRREAVAYAYAAHNVDAAAGLIAQWCEELALHHGEHSTLLRWVEPLPPHCLERWPVIRLTLAWSLMMTNRIRRARAELACWRNAPEQGGRAPRTRRSAAFADMIDCVIEAIRDNQTVARRLSTKWFADWPDAPDIYCGAVHLVLAYACHESATCERALVEVESARAAFVRCRGHYGRATACAVHGSLLLKRGELAAAERVLTSGLHDARHDWGDHAQPTSLIALLLSAAYYETNRLALANDALRAAAVALDEIAAVELVAVGPAVTARLQHGRGDDQAAIDTLVAWQRRASAMHLLRLRGLLLLDQLRLSLRMARAGHARRIDEARAVDARLRACARSAPDDASGLVAAFAEMQAIAAALLLSATGAEAEAVGAWTRLIAGPGLRGRAPALVEALLHKAACLHRLDRVNEALRTLDEALQIGARHGLQRSYADERALIAPLLARYAAGRARVARSELPAGFVDAVLALCGVAWPPAPVPESTLPDGTRGEAAAAVTLTSKETQMLQLIEQGLSNREISAVLFVSEATVKWHVHNIYAKLGVHQRTAALVRAHAVGLLH